jgi:hypothetical protein
MNNAECMIYQRFYFNEIFLFRFIENIFIWNVSHTSLIKTTLELQSVQGKILSL